MSTHFSDEEWRIAHQAHEEVRARAIAEGRTYSRDEIADRIVELDREDRDAKLWKARALKAEAELQALAAAPRAEGVIEERERLIAFLDRVLLWDTIALDVWEANMRAVQNALRVSAPSPTGALIARYRELEDGLVTARLVIDTLEEHVDKALDLSQQADEDGPLSQELMQASSDIWELRQIWKYPEWDKARASASSDEERTDV